jgi:phage/conjugal plasmid C-4 type zinc finger TraR family protein
MSSLNTQELDALAQLLDRREATLQQEVRAAKEADADRPSAIAPQVDDEVAGGQEHVMRGIQHVELLRDQEELREIERARERLADGSYGECVDCGKDIPVARLQAQPMAARCVACQEKWELRHDPMPRYAA